MVFVLPWQWRSCDSFFVVEYKKAEYTQQGLDFIIDFVETQDFASHTHQVKVL